MKNLIIALLIFGSSAISCSSDDSSPSKNKSDLNLEKITFYQVSSTEANTFNQLAQATINLSNTLQITTFGAIDTNGYAAGIDKIYAFNKNTNTETAILLDENNAPAFIYEINVSTGEKSRGITEFEPIENNKFFVRLYDYDWENRLGTLLFETIITKSGSSFTTSPTFDTSENSTTKIGKVNTCFSSPILRLEKIKNQSNSKVTNNRGLLDDFINDLTNFVNNDISEYLDTIQDISLPTAVGAGAAVLLGAAGASPLFVGAAALTLASEALEFLLEGSFNEIIDSIQDNFNATTENGGESISEILDIINGYGETASEWLNNDFTNLNLSEILDLIEENELFPENESLDDLPDSNGVLQIGLSWNTNNTDIDLYVQDPNGESINYTNPSSNSGGYLDRDDTDGYGPENIYWNGNYLDGSYTISVNYFGCNLNSCPATNFTIKVSDGLGYLETFNGILNTVDETIYVVSFAVSNSQISIL